MARSLRLPLPPKSRRERDIVDILNRLEGGLPLGNLDAFGIIRQDPSNLLPLVKSLVNRSREEGCTSQRATVWVVAPRGGGKTETLGLLERELLVEDHMGNDRKSIAVSVDLKRFRQATTGPGLQAEIFMNATATSSSQFKQRIDELAAHLVEDTKSDAVRENMIALGLDVALSLVKVSAPGLSLLGTGIFSYIWRSFRLRDGNIQKLLRARGVVSPDAVSLLIKWIRYSVQPSRENWQKLEEVFDPLAERDSLFPILCETLQATGYTTITLLIDEADHLVGARQLTQAFERLWDPPKESDTYQYQINIIFVLAGTHKIDLLDDEEHYGGFTRRFLGTRAVRSRQCRLRPPTVESTLNNFDDCGHAINKVRELIQRLVGFDAPTFSPEQELKLRERLIALADSEELSWHALWAAVIEECSGGALVITL